MKAENFAYWLQGYFELHADAHEECLSVEQVATIKKHLAMVFVHDIDPKMGDAVHQAALNELHAKPKAKAPKAVKEAPVKEVHHHHHDIAGRPPLIRC